MYNMDVLSVSEAWAVAQEIFGEAMLYENATSYYSSVAQLMQAQGWTAVTKGSEVLYYTKPAQVALSTGVKTYTQVAEVTSVTVAESGAVTGATATTTGVGVTVAEAAIGGAVAACLGYNVGNKIYEANPEWWDGLLNEVNEWTVENVPEGGVNAIVTVLEGVDTVLTFPSSLIERIKNYSIETGAFTDNITIDYDNVPTSAGQVSLTIGPVNSSYASKSISYSLSNNANIDEYARFCLATLLSNVGVAYSKAVEIANNKGINYNGIQCGCSYSNYNNYSGEATGTVTFTFFNKTILKEIAYAPSAPIMYYWITATENNNAIDISFKQSSKDGYYKPTISSGIHSIQNIRFPIGYGVEDYSSFGSKDKSLYLNSLNVSSITEGNDVNGTKKQDGATYPTINTPISETYPDWWNRRKPISNGEGSTTDWLPVSIPSLDPVTLGNPQTQVQAQSGTATDTENNPNVDVADSSGVSNKDNNPDSTDNGDTPIVAPLTSLYGIAGIYNPTLEQITSFSNWLWSENPITQLQQMFSNPMNAIIGLHLIYATPHTSSEKMIGVGYLSSGVLSKVVDEQYITIDCGTIDIPSYYNNVNDWNPYTKITCYLPFIGMVKLNTDDLMSSKDKFSQLNITYKVDVLTGACLAMLKVKRGNSDAVLYQYNGSCSVQLPLTSGNYGSVIASLITTAVGVVSGFAPLAIGGAMGLTHPKADIQRSGQLGANVGAMGIKKPYLIIERPYSKYAGSYGEHIGYPSNNTIKLSACSGFTRVKSTNVNNINTTEEERKMILNLLTDGIYI